MPFCFLSVQAQKNIQYGNQQWIQYYTRILLNDHWYIPADAGIRWRSGLEELSQHIVRAGIGYQFNSGITVGAGITQSGFYSDGHLRSSEIRPYQEASFTQAWNKISLINRLRLEERFFSYRDGRRSEFNFRLRYRLMLNMPLFTFHSPGRKLSLLLGDELFLNAGKNIVYNTFDQNRIVTGIQYSTGNLDLALNYNHQFAARNAPGKFMQEYILWLTCNQTINLRKKDPSKTN